MSHVEGERGDIAARHEAYKRGEVDEVIETYLHRVVADHQVSAAYRAYSAGKSSGTPTEMQIFDLLSFRDGLIVRRQTFYTETEALEADGLRE